MLKEHREEPNGPGQSPNSSQPLLKVSKTQLELSPTLLLPARAIRLCMVHCRLWLGGLGLGWVGSVGVGLVGVDSKDLIWCHSAESLVTRV